MLPTVVCIAHFPQAKERLLQSMFEPGRPMPSSSEVSQLRSTIASLKSQLNGGAPSPVTRYAVQSSAGLGVGAAPPPMQPVQVQPQQMAQPQPFGVGRKAETAELARRALDQVMCCRCRL
jgi:hypothetical protein